MTGEDLATLTRLAQSRASERKPKHPRRWSGLPTRLSRELFAGAEMVRLRAGQVLFRAGDPGNGCYRVEDGLLKVTIVSSSGTERILAFLGRGAIVGELAVLDGLARSASVVAVRDVTLSWLSRAEFEAFAEEHPEVYKSLVKLLAHRLRETDTVPDCTALGRGRGVAISARNVVAMNHFVTLSFVVLLVALMVALDGSLALNAVDRLAQSEAFTDIQRAR